MAAPARARNRARRAGVSGEVVNQNIRSSPPLASGGARQVGVARAGPAAHYCHLAQITDGLVLLAAFPLAYLVKTRVLPSDLTSLYDPSVYFAPAGIFAVAVLVFLARRGAYEPLAFLHLRPLIVPLVGAFGQAFLVGYAILFAFKLGYVSRLFVGIYAGTALLFLLAARLTLRRFATRLRASGAGAARVLLVASEVDGIRVTGELNREAPFGVTIVGRVAPEDLHALAEQPVGADQRIADIFASEAVDEVVVASSGFESRQIGIVIDACEREGVALHFASSVFGCGMERVLLDQVGDIRLLSMNSQAHAPFGRAAKRIFDFATATLLLLFSLPAWPLIALAIRFETTGPVFYTQERLGLNKRHFRMLKFRSMVEDADHQLSDVHSLNEADGPIFKLRDDPRVTRVGRLLRRIDIDELPQLLNVLMGQMSIIGPRPMLPDEITGFEPWQRKRFSMLPGITGLWQVSNRLGDPFLAGLEADLDYIDGWSWSLDFEILLRTIPAVLRNRAAR
jgi:exopolysaccharide biosynthesis polyprenyl glycosylphosphotransferase